MVIELNQVHHIIQQYIHISDHEWEKYRTLFRVKKIPKKKYFASKG